MKQPDFSSVSTIAALATPPGAGGLSVVRISGPDSVSLLSAVFSPAGKQTVEAMPSHRLTYGHVVDAARQPLDESMAVLMRAPRSYTREDVAEIHCHGGHISSSRILSLLFANGAKPAAPGEFTRRAFENGRIDLSQAEAVQQFINASGTRAADSALSQMMGGVSRQVQSACAAITAQLAAVEASIDFPDEVDEQEAIALLLPQTRAWAKKLRDACDERRARVLRDGLRVVIVGPPNVGKSSLLNALLMEERAIVTDIPGTTRDILTESLWLDGVLVHLSDTAGLHESEDHIERIGITRAQAAMQRADVCTFVMDASKPWNDQYLELLQLPFSGTRLVLLNKDDLPRQLTPADVQARLPDVPVIALSAKEETGLATLTDCLIACATDGPPADTLLTNARHIDAAKSAAIALEHATRAIEEGVELDLCAVDLRDALHHLGAITGEDVDEDVLNRIFSDFCVGK